MLRSSHLALSFNQLGMTLHDSPTMWISMVRAWCDTVESLGVRVRPGSSGVCLRIRSSRRIRRCHFVGLAHTSRFVVLLGHATVA